MWGELVQGQLTPDNRRGKGQGYFRYYNKDGTFHSIVAVNGRLLRNGGDLPIEGLEDGFQKTRMIEAVQYLDKLYIATGTKLVVYDGREAKVVEPHRPQPLEALYVGTNALADFPDQYLDDGVEEELSIAGVTVDKRKGVVNEESTFTAYINKPEDMTVKYKFQYKLAIADTFIDGTDWQSEKTWKFIPDRAADFEIQVLVKEENAPDNEAVNYIVPKYTVTTYDENEYPDVSGIHTCNRILLHWDRLILYGDTQNRSTIYISHVRNPTYFPTNNTLVFETDKQEPLVKLVQFRDFIVAFLPSNIQALHGKSPLDYQRVKIQSGIGCIAPESVAIYDNYVVFLSKEGIYLLKSYGVGENRLNVERLDTKIRNIIPPYPQNEQACAINFDDQYHICFPNLKQRFRYYWRIGHWTKDQSPYFDFCRFVEYKGELIAQRASTGEIYKFDDNVYDDLGYAYEDRIETKSFNFGHPYNFKKLKELHVMVGLEKHDTNLSVEVYGDSSALMSTDSSYISIVNEKVVWNEQFTPNVSLDSGTVFGEWNLGVDAFGYTDMKVYKLKLRGGKKYRTSKIVIRHNEPKPYSLLGLGWIYKLKKP